MRPVSFAEASQVTPGPEPGVFEAEIHAGWDIAGNADGGYLLALCSRALCGATGRPDVLSMTGHYLAPGRPGPIELRPRLERSGGRHSTASVLMVDSDGVAILSCVGTATDLSGAEGPELVAAEPPDLPEPDACVQVFPGDPFPPPFMGRIDLRLVPEDARFYEGEPSGRARVRGWFRLRDDEPPDTHALVLATDSFPPTIFNASLPVAWTPTIELTTHVRSRPPGAGEWMGCAFETRFIAGGYLEADGEIWSRAGRLLAQSRQLALVPRA